MQKIYVSVRFIILVLFCNLAHYQYLEAQECLSEEIHQWNLQNNPQYAQKYEQTEALILERLRAKYLENPLQGKPKKTQTGLKTPALHTLPVVVHIIHNGGTENISDAQVQVGIQHLNDAFRLKPPYNGALGADVEIEFCLAKQDEFGNPTTGINRVVSTLTDHNSTNDLTLKNLSRWDSNKYINIWLVKEICMPSYGCSVAGYAYYASAHGSSFDGIVNEAKWFGSSTNNSKIHIHEVGHYLNLRHTFDGGCVNNDCLVNGDQVCDTPPDNSKSGVACASSVNTCTTDEDDTSTNNPFREIGLGGLGDQPDMHQNYMDYGFQSCQNAFTQGQKDRMIDALTNIRGSLLTSLGCENPCINPITLDIISSEPTAVALGTNVIFTNNTTGAAGYTWDWQVEGVLEGSTADFNYTFLNTGSFTVKLIASNGNISCQKDTSIVFQVICPAFTANFTSSQSNIIAGDNVNFTNTTIGADTYEWFINGVSQATSTDFSNTFNTQGSYIIELVATQAASMCSYSVSDTVNVTCPVEAFFSSSSTDINQNTVIDFTNTSLNAVSYIWKIDGVTQSTSTDFSYNFTALGDFVITLIANNGICADSIQQVINVGDATRCTQRQADYWYFGAGAGLNFFNGNPTVLFDGQMYAEEGCATVSNEFGNLLFYSNGVNIWARNHTIMPNGSGLNGDIGSTQSVHIVPRPGSTTIYYVFTTDKEGGPDGLQYSEVDMTLNSGFGDVVSTAKNIPLQTPVSEKLTALMHGNQCDVWLIAHGWENNTFYAYLITSQGLQTTPITSAVGTIVGSTGGVGTATQAGGQLKASPLGDRLAMAIRGSNPTSSGAGVQAFEVYDFDNFSGVVGNPITLATSTNPNQAISNPYGVEFSPNGSKVYMSSIFDNIYQFDLEAGSTTDIINSRQSLINNNQQNQYYALQLAPNRKIYVAKGFSSSLGVIENPDETIPTAFYIGNNIGLTNPDRGEDGPFATQGLPGLIPNNFKALDFSYVCSGGGEIVFFLNTTTSGNSTEKIIWNFGDPTSGSANTSDQSTPTHTYATSGLYTITLQVQDNCLCTYIEKDILIDANCLINLSSQIIEFQAQKDSDFSAKLDWKIQANIPVKSIHLERATDVSDFLAIQSINKSETISTYLDKDNLLKSNSVWYYRLKVELESGQILYSEAKMVSFSEIKWQISPNPVPQNQSFVLQSEKAPRQLQLTLKDGLGKTVWQHSYQNVPNLIEVNPKIRASGVYFLEIRTELGVEILKVLIE
jgi:PKD repeat protein